MKRFALIALLLSGCAAPSSLTDASIMTWGGPLFDISPPQGSGGGGVATLTPWTEDIDAAGYVLTDAGGTLDMDNSGAILFTPASSGDWRVNETDGSARIIVDDTTGISLCSNTGSAQFSVGTGAVFNANWNSNGNATFADLTEVIFGSGTDTQMGWQTGPRSRA